MEYEIYGKNIRININGDIDHYKASSISGKIDKLIEQNHIKNIIFDFSNVDFCDSSGIGLIMGRYKKIAFMNGQVYAAGVKPSVDRIFNLSGLYKIIKKYEDVEITNI